MAETHLDRLQLIEEGRTSDDNVAEAALFKRHTDDKRSVRSFTWIIASLIILFGVIACASIIAFGIISLNNEQTAQFERVVEEVVSHIENAFIDYRSAGLWVHHACRERTINRTQFQELYDHVISDGLQVLGANMIFNVTDDERPKYEDEARAFYNQHYPDIEYNGFVGLEPDNASDTGYSVQPRSRQPFYYVVHLIAPVEANARAADFDLWSSEIRQETIQTALDTWQPALTERLVLVQETEGTYSVVLMHPGVPVSTNPDDKPNDVSNIVIRIPDLLNRATDSISYPVSVYLYDSTHDRTPDDQFLAGVVIHSAKPNVTKVFTPEIELNTLRSQAGKQLWLERTIKVANKRWIVAVQSSQGDYKANLTFVLFGAIVTLLGCSCIALWVISNSRRIAKISQINAAAEAEKTALILENAKHAASIERDMNDWIAHEVRNPVAAAMSACTFVKNALSEKEPMKDENAVKCAREDINIIDNSLQFINELLRNMLDLHRLSSNRLKVVMKPTDILLDVFEPVDSMLYRRNSKYEVIIECPENLIVMTDRLRLKQIILNLARNSSKFLIKGYIRLKATVDDGKVVIYVEDSGTGIPPSKKEQLFDKYQSSLDSLNQGTGIGLSLCKNLIELMGGRLWLDESFDCGIEGFPGARFVVDLSSPPLQYESERIGPRIRDSDSSSHSSAEDEIRSQLPKTQSILFVDDDLVLRKLFSRSVRKILPDWTVREVSNGETAIRLCETEAFDLIFMDQYMASVEKQLLGTETVHALRANGFKNRICGLSANNVEDQFLQAGADAFMFKPFPCEGGALLSELHRILSQTSGEAFDNTKEGTS